MRKPGKEKRSIRILILMAAIVASLVCYVKFRSTPPILPPESVEIAAQRQAAHEWVDKHAEPVEQATKVAEEPVPLNVHENAYITLCEAVELLPDTLENPEQTLLGYAINVQFSIMNPPMRNYVEGSALATEKAREAFGADYFRYPSLDWPGTKRNPLDVIVAAQFARGLFLSRSENRHDEGLQFLIDALETDAILNNDGDNHRRFNGLTRFDCYYEVASKVQSEEVLRNGLARLEAIKRWERSPRDLLETQWRLLEQSPKKRLPRWDKELSYRQMVVNNFLNNLGAKDAYLDAHISKELRKYKQVLSGHKEDLLNAVALPFPEFVHERYPVDSKDTGEAVYFCETVAEVQRKQGQFRQDRRKVQLILALKLYMRIHDVYPKQLDDLTPDCLTVLPLDPFLEKPFGYERVDSSYQLSFSAVSILVRYASGTYERELKWELIYDVSYFEGSYSYGLSSPESNSLEAL